MTAIAPPPQPLQTDEAREATHRYALAATAAALVAGIAGDILLWQSDAPGLNVLLWTLFVVGAAWAACRRVDRPLQDPERRWLLAPLIALAAMPVVRDSSMVLLVDLLTGLLIVAVLLSPATRRFSRFGVGSYLEAGFFALFSTCVGSIVLLVEIRWGRLFTATGRARSIGPWVRGVALALPVLLVFALLFAAADAAFAKSLREIFNFEVSSSLEHLFVVLLIAAPVAGALRLLLYRGLAVNERTTESARLAAARKPDQVRGGLGIIETNVVLGLVAALFASFLAVQARYLFGGHELVQERLGMTYAAYARRGFAELVVVAFLTLVLLYTLDRWRRPSGRRSEHVFRGLTIGLMVLLALVMGSALERLRVYMQAYGLTELRVLAVCVLVWIGLSICWLAVSIIRERRDTFLLGSFAAGIAVVLAWNLVNPAGLVAARNASKRDVRITRTISSASYDAGYATTLSADAIPALVSRIEKIPQPKRARVAKSILADWDSRSSERPANGWREWNLARHRAFASVEEHRGVLRRAAATG